MFEKVLQKTFEVWLHEEREFKDETPYVDEDYPGN